MRLLVVSIHDIMLWKKFLLLPMMLFGNYGNEAKREFGSGLDLLMKGKWDEFSLGDYVKREDAILASTIDENVLNERKNIRGDKMIAAGEYGGAFNF
jgi:hypothetical protein